MELHHYSPVCLNGLFCTLRHICSSVPPHLLFWSQPLLAPFPPPPTPLSFICSFMYFCPFPLCLTPLQLTVQLWRWRQHVPPHCWYNFCHTTKHHIPEDCDLHSHYCKELKSSTECAYLLILILFHFYYLLKVPQQVVLPVSKPVVCHYREIWI